MTAPVPLIQRELSKPQIVELFRTHLEGQGFHIAECDMTRPWGAFLRVSNADADRFIATYLDGVEIPAAARRGERSPKFLLVAPGQRLSWQHHDRRSEFWRSLGGKVGVATSPTNEQPNEFKVLAKGDVIELPCGTRHRLIGLDEWGVVAEIWMHTDPAHLSDENDIHRHQDDYQR